MDSIDTEEFAEEAPKQIRSQRPRHGGSVLMAAMVGLAEALDMGREPTEMVQPADATGTNGLDLAFGPLPPLD